MLPLDILLDTIRLDIFQLNVSDSLQPDIIQVRGAVKLIFQKNLGIWPKKGGCLTEAQAFVEIFQNQICLGKWP